MRITNELTNHTVTLNYPPVKTVLNVKMDVFERVSQCCKPSAVIATNTIRLNVNSIAERAAYKERTLGLRFLFPVYYIPEVEITPSPKTSGDTIERGLTSEFTPVSDYEFRLCFMDIVNRLLQ